MGIRELRDTLTQAIRRVRAGETIEVTHDGEPVAVIISVPAKPARAADLRREGNTRATVPPSQAPDRGEGPEVGIGDDPRGTAPIAERLVYADSSALVKLVVREPESSRRSRAFIPTEATTSVECASPRSK